MKKISLAIISAIIITNTFASNKECNTSAFLQIRFCNQFYNELQPIIDYASENIYRSLMCSHNVLEVIKTLSKEGYDLSEAKVVHIQHKSAPYLGIKAKQQRTKVNGKNYRPSSWVFHSILILNGLVLDLDFTNTPELIDFNTYMIINWDQEEIKNYVFQIKPALDYGGYDLNGSLSKEKYPKYNYTDIKRFF
jgi:hypothetical protein